MERKGSAREHTWRGRVDHAHTQVEREKTAHELTHGDREREKATNAHMERESTRVHTLRGRE